MSAAVGGCAVAGGGDGGGSSSRRGCGDRLVAEVVTVLKPHWPPFCYQAPGSLLSWEMPGALGPLLRVIALQCDRVVREHSFRHPPPGSPGAQR